MFTPGVLENFLKVECVVCKAKPGHRCTGFLKLPMGTPHVPRREAAYAMLQRRYMGALDIQD